MKQYFQHGVLEVTDQLVKARGRSIQLSKIESVDLSRLVFFLALGLFGLLALFGILFVDLLFWYEIILFLAIAAGAIYGALQLGTLTVYTKLTGASGWPIIGRFDTMRDMRSAIERAMDDRDRKRPTGSRGGAVTQEPDDEDDQETEAE